MTAISEAHSSNPEAVRGGGVRTPAAARSAEEAQEARSRGPWPEFTAALLMATAGAGPAPASTPIVESHAGSGRPSAAASRAVVAQAVESMTRSQADRLRTVGSGVSLSSLAQAELEGRLNGAGGEGVSEKPADGQDAGGDAGPTGRNEPPERSKLEPRGRPDWQSGRPERAEAGPSQDAKPPASSLRGAPGDASPSRAPESAGAIDRLVAAGARVAAAGSSAGAAIPVSMGGMKPVGGVSQATSQAASPVPGSGHSGGASGRDSAVGGGARAWSARGAEAPLSKRGPDEPFSVQVHRALAQALRAKDGHLTLRLTPEHLGTLRVELQRAESGMAARFEAASPQAHKLLAESMPELRTALEARGVRVESIEVRLAEPAAADAERGSIIASKPEAGTSQDATASWDGSAGGDPQAEQEARSRGGDGRAATDGRAFRDPGPGGAPGADRARGTEAPKSAAWSDDPIRVGLIEVVA